MQRYFDIALSGIALLLLCPMLLPIALVLRFSGEGEIFFLQKRIGKNGEIFNLFKFATMLKDSPNFGTGTITMKGDPRILPVGKFLRTTKINELPQLLNVFIGDMSLIGPRPLTEQTFKSYPLTFQESIKLVKPGLSGIGSIVFHHEEEIMAGPYASIDFYDNTIAPYKGALEEWFVSNRGIYVYFMAILLTVWVIFSSDAKIIWRVFKNLPKPPNELRDALDYVN